MLHIDVPPLTEDDGHLPVRLGVGVGGAVLWVDDDGAMHSGAVEVAVCVPPQRPLLLDEVDAVGEVGARLDGALRDVLRPVGPRVPRLVHVVPVEGDVLAALVVMGGYRGYSWYFHEYPTFYALSIYRYIFIYIYLYLIY